MIAITPVFMLLILTEYLWRIDSLKGEAARKTIHIIVGTYVAFWPFFISFEAIQLISVAFLFVIALSLKFSIFGSIHGVARRTWGEVLFAVGIGLTAVLTNQPWVFAACILHMSVADGLAALVGIKWGKSTTYLINGHKKSVVGTATFWLCSLIITAVAVWHLPYLYIGSSSIIFALPFLTALVENISTGGTDNVLVPILVYLVLS